MQGARGSHSLIVRLSSGNGRLLLACEDLFLPALEAILVLHRLDPSAGDLRPSLTIFLYSHEKRVER